MSDERTVRDFTREHWRTPMRMLDELGLDPDMSVAELRTMLALGKHMLGEQQTDIMADLAIAKRARETERRSGALNTAAMAHGWNACLDHILGSKS